MITIGSRTGTVIYLSDTFTPVAAERATLAKVLFDDGGSAFYTVSQQRAAGGPGSGNFGHAGRPGQVGGSAASYQFQHHISTPSRQVDAMRIITRLTGVKSVFVSDHPMALKASVEVAEVLQEMKDKGYQMPDSVLIERVEQSTIAGETMTGADPDDPIGQRTVKSFLTIRVPERVPADIDLDTMVSKAFGGQTRVTSDQPLVDRFAVRTFKDIVVHEMGHVQHMMQKNTPTIDDVRGQLNKARRDDESFRVTPWIDATTREVSDYATKNSKEFVAESFTRLYRGEKLSPNVMELYTLLKGPEVRP